MWATEFRDVVKPVEGPSEFIDGCSHQDDGSVTEAKEMATDFQPRARYVGLESIDFPPVSLAQPDFPPVG